MTEIKRTFYLNMLKKYLHAPAAVAVTGLRRVGKSVLLRQLCKELEPSARVVYIDKESLEFDHVQSAPDIVKHCNKKAPKGEYRSIRFKFFPALRRFGHTYCREICIGTCISPFAS